MGDAHRSDFEEEQDLKRAQENKTVFMRALEQWYDKNVMNSYDMKMVVKVARGGWEMNHANGRILVIEKEC